MTSEADVRRIIEALNNQACDYRKAARIWKRRKKPDLAKAADELFEETVSCAIRFGADHGLKIERLP